MRMTVTEQERKLLKSFRKNVPETRKMIVGLVTMSAEMWRHEMNDAIAAVDAAERAAEECAA